MDAQRWQQVKAVFQDVLDQPVEHRRAYLEHACAGDEQLLQDVLALLTADDAAIDFMDVPAVIEENLIPDPQPRIDVGSMIGSYRLIRELGSGGMGRVFLAERADAQFKKRVAIKLVRQELDTERLLRRFRTERQILARLEHPSIARLLDGGVTETGLPYLVMEYIDGQPIDEYCDAFQLDTNERLALFQTVCNAVQYAHQNLIVHRDLKPGNILVTRDRAVKLLDFGIAKLLDAEGFEQTIPRTRTGLYMMTPAYASPEQVKGATITTASDVYALGLVLYELLTGHRPYEFNTLSPADVERIICEVEPDRPSTVVTRVAGTQTSDLASKMVTPEEIGKKRSTAPDRLRRRLSGDLDTIIMMALRKEPERRYNSVAALADDIRRHLEGLPVVARGDTLGYLFSRYIQRHKGSVIAAGLVICSLIAGMIGVLWQAQVANEERAKAERRFNDVRQLARDMLFEFHDAIADIPGSTEERERLVTRGLHYLDRLAQEEIDDRSLQLELAAAYRKVGDVQGNPTNANLGQVDAALESYQKALTLVQPLIDLDALDIEARLLTALVYERMSDVEAARGELDRARDLMRKGLSMYEALAGEHPSDLQAQVRHGVGLIKIGDVSGNPNFPNLEQHAEALNHYREALTIFKRLYEQEGDREGIFRRLGLVYERIGTMHEVEEDIEAAQEAYAQSLQIREQYAAANPNSTNAVRDLAIAHEKMADMAVQGGNLDLAWDRYEKSRRIFEDLFRADTLNVQARQSLSIAHLHLGGLAGHPEQPNLGNPARSLQHYRIAESHLDYLFNLDSTNTRTRFLLDLTREDMAEVVEVRGEGLGAGPRR